MLVFSNSAPLLWLTSHWKTSAQVTLILAGKVWFDPYHELCGFTPPASCSGSVSFPCSFRSCCVISYLYIAILPRSGNPHFWYVRSY
ncbi:hypothetical protein BD779DRAFT_232208 [Infundibulicybe gibba]|nr:hypothetical protein BD779DRAFT_232208 [Infundibulicybe gibba]